MNMLLLALKSMRSRKFTVIMTILSIALSVALLLGVERIRTESRNSFANTISNTDLIVGARSGAIQLLLYSVFRIGDATNNISWQSYQEFTKDPAVSWTIPLSLGDSHKGYRVLGTTQEYFDHFSYGHKEHLQFTTGHAFNDLYDAVIGAEVAENLGYRVGDKVILTHGSGDVSFADHTDKPFKVAGILDATGTPVDQTIHVSLTAIEAIHLGWESGAPGSGSRIPADHLKRLSLTPKAITAFLVKLQSPLSIFSLQRAVNEYEEEALTAIMPGIALHQLWQLLGIAEKALLVVSGFVVVVGLFGMMTSLLTSLNERRREMAILRSVGATPLHVFSLVIGEALLITLSGIVAGNLLLYGLLFLAQPIMQSSLGLSLAISMHSPHEILILATISLAGLVAGTIPAIRIYRYSLHDGMTIKS